MAGIIHLDSNYLIACAGGERVVAQVEKWIIEDRKICCSGMAWAEFLCGPVLADEVETMKSLLHSH